MKTAARLSVKRLMVFIPVFFILICLGSGYAAEKLDQVETILGVKGQMQEGATVFSFPRSDIKVTVDGDPVPTGLGFGGS